MILLLSTAFGGGYFFSDSGIVAAGRSGAWIAGADTQFAQYHNPAGLIRVENPTLNIGLGLVQQNTRFARVDGEGVELPETRNEAAPFKVPQLGFATPLVKDKLAMAFGIVSPYAPSSQWDPAGGQRYSIVDAEIFQFTWGPSFAYRPHPMVTVGLGLQAKVIWLEQSLNVSGAGTDVDSGDINVRAKVADFFTPNVNFGLLVEPHDAVSIGFSAQPGTQFDATGHAVLDLTAGSFGGVVEGDVDVFQDGNCDASQTDPVCANEDGIGLSLRLPLVLRGGVAVRPVESLEIELAVVWQNWATLDNILLTDVDPTLTVFGNPADIDSEFALPAGLGNTTSIRLGGEWRTSDLLELRAGAAWESGAFADERLNASLYDTDKTQASLGASVHPMGGRLRFDAALAAIFLPRKTITNSEVQLVNVDVLDQNRAPATVGNGNYASNGWVAAVQASVLFGALD